MKHNVVYNRPGNQVFVKTDGDLIYIICNTEEQQDTVVKKMTTDNCLLESYEVWEDNQVIHSLTSVNGSFKSLHHIMRISL